MRKSLKMIAGVFLFVLVFSFSHIQVEADEAAIVMESGIELSGTASFNTDLGYYIRTSFIDLGILDFSSYVDGSSDMYKIEYDLGYEFDFDSAVPGDYYLANVSIYSSNTEVLLYLPTVYSDLNNPGSYDVVQYISSDALNKTYQCSFLSYSNTPITCYLGCTLSIDNIVVTPMTQSDSDQYQNGYNSGYLEGLMLGQNQGYSSGYSDGYNAGETSGYNSGYQAGVDSVDIQSYYDAGYQAGQSAGYAQGYDSGYDSGYDAAMSRVEQWGADTTQYPFYVTSWDLTQDYDISFPVTDEPKDYFFKLKSFGSVLYEYDPYHVYCLKGVISHMGYYGYSQFSSIDLYAKFGGHDYFISTIFDSPGYVNDLDRQFQFFIPGNLMSASSQIYAVVRNCRVDPSVESQNFIFRFSGMDITLSDYGPISGTQNETAKQTDDLTQGYDSSAGESASQTFADNAASLDAAERSIFTSAKSSLDGYTFFDIESVPAVVSGLSFVSATMTSIFGAMGGASGAGIVLSVLFSVMIVSIVIGLYRYYVSSGKSGSGKGGRK